MPAFYWPQTVPRPTMSDYVKVFEKTPFPPTSIPMFGIVFSKNLLIPISILNLRLVEHDSSKFLFLLKLDKFG